MKVWLALAILCVPGAEAQAPGAPPTPRPSTIPARMVEGVDAVARRYALAGEVLVAKGGKVLLDRGYGTIRPNGGAAHRAGERWRLASITKQVTAALIVRAVTRAGDPRPLLDTSLSLWPNVLTLRSLLTHHTGAANPDDTPQNGDGTPLFYLNAKPDLSFCRSRRPRTDAPFAYNNCDYVLAYDVAEEVGDASLRAWPSGMSIARLNEVGVPGFVRGKPEPRFQLASWGAAGGLMGTARAVFNFDRSLMTGKLLPPAALAALWKPEGNGSYQALGQWVFPGTLKGCAAPRRIVQRDGEIWGVQARNFILPDDDLVVIVFTNRSADDFPMGEVWQGRGFAYDLLSAAACG